MSQSQKNAHKSSGECSVCHAVRQLHNSNGTVHRHGPRNNPCPGSDKPPVAVRPYVLPTTLQQSAASIISNHQSTDRRLGFNLVDTGNRSGFSRWVLTSTASTTMHKAHTEVSQTSMRSTLRRAPKALAARAMHTICNLHAWEELLNFGTDVLAQPTRDGKRYNLASIIEADHRATQSRPRYSQPQDCLRTQPLYWSTQSRSKSRTGTSELLSESCVPKISPCRTRTACTHNWSASTLHLPQIVDPFQIHNQRWLWR